MIKQKPHLGYTFRRIKHFVLAYTVTGLDVLRNLKGNIYNVNHAIK